MINVKSLLAKPFAGVIHRQIQKDRKNALKDQQDILNQLIKVGKNTLFGKEHHFEKVNDYPSFQKAVPLRDYEQFIPYIDQIKKALKTCFGRADLSILPKPAVRQVG